MNPSPAPAAVGGASAAPRRRSFAALLVVAVVLSNLAAIVLGGLSLSDSRERAEEAAYQSTRNLARMLDQSLASSARTIDVALLALVDELEREESEGDAYLKADEIVDMLARFKGWLPETEGIRVYDAEGRPRWTSGPKHQGLFGIAERDYFITLRNNPEAGLIVSRPLVGGSAEGGSSPLHAASIVRMAPLAAWYRRWCPSIISIACCPAPSSGRAAVPCCATSISA